MEEKKEKGKERKNNVEGISRVTEVSQRERYLAVNGGIKRRKRSSASVAKSKWNSCSRKVESG